MEKDKDIIKACKEHGVQNVKFSFCPYCGVRLEEKPGTYELPRVNTCGDEVKDLALYEARSTAWNLIGIRGNVGFVLGKSNITPQQLQSVFNEGYKVKGIGQKTVEIIKTLNETDFKNFDKSYNKLIEENSWTWCLAKWCFSSIDGYTNGEYMNKKTQFKKEYANGVLKLNNVYELPKANWSDNRVEELAIKEARMSAWLSIGIGGASASKLSESSVSPNEIVTILNQGRKIYNIGVKIEKLLKNLEDNDFQLFDKVFETLKGENSWTWKLSKWYYSLSDSCTNGEYSNKKTYFKNMYANGL